VVEGLDSHAGTAVAAALADAAELEVGVLAAALGAVEGAWLLPVCVPQAVVTSIVAKSNAGQRNVFPGAMGTPFPEFRDHCDSRRSDCRWRRARPKTLLSNQCERRRIHSMNRRCVR
jgi:hypothetical protein